MKRILVLVFVLMLFPIIVFADDYATLTVSSEIDKNNDNIVNIKVDIEMNNLKLKKSLSNVNERNIPIVIIIGENERTRLPSTQNSIKAGETKIPVKEASR